MLKKNKVTKISAHKNNCAFHCIVPYIAAYVEPNVKFPFNSLKPTEQARKGFTQRTGYQQFLTAFKQYYQLENNVDVSKALASLLRNHPHPLDQQVLIGPVLRLQLSHILQHNEQAKSSLKESFNVLISNLRQQIPQRQQLTIEQVATQITALQDVGAEFEELLQPNIQLLATVIRHNRPLSSAQWNEAYSHFIEYLQDENIATYISEDYLKLLGAVDNWRAIYPLRAAA